MIELLGGGFIGSLLGGLFRLAPEVLKWLDKKDERKHELSMFDKQCELEKTRGDIKLQEIGAQRDMAIDVGMVEAFKSAIDQQTEMAKAAGGKIAALSASVRPVMTYYVLALYGIVKLAVFALAVSNDETAAHIVGRIWTPDDMTLLCGVVNYWILDRSLAKRGLA